MGVAAISSATGPGDGSLSLPGHVNRINPRIKTVITPEIAKNFFIAWDRQRSVDQSATLKNARAYTFEQEWDETLQSSSGIVLRLRTPVFATCYNRK
jgi:hypothetical protein